MRTWRALQEDTRFLIFRIIGNKNKGNKNIDVLITKHFQVDGIQLFKNTQVARFGGMQAFKNSRLPRRTNSNLEFGSSFF